MFYMYVGSTQILGPTMHLFGYYMFFVGVRRRADWLLLAGQRCFLAASSPNLETTSPRPAGPFHPARR